MTCVSHTCTRVSLSHMHTLSPSNALTFALLSGMRAMMRAWYSLGALFAAAACRNGSQPMGERRSPAKASRASQSCASDRVRIFSQYQRGSATCAVIM